MNEAFSGAKPEMIKHHAMAPPKFRALYWCRKRFDQGPKGVAALD